MALITICLSVIMFKQYKDLVDVVSLLVYCPADRSYLLSKESSGEFWLPSCRAEGNCWKLTAHKIHFELFGSEASVQCSPLRVHKVWLPTHTQPSLYHAVYKVAVKADVKKKTKIKALRTRLLWMSTVELERQRAHSTLRSPEVVLFAQMAVGEQPTESDTWEFESGLLVEVCENNLLVGPDTDSDAAGAAAQASPNYQLLQAANYNKDDQIRIYREFLTMVFPALYMSPQVFSQFMLDVGWPRDQCSSLFRAADITGRGGLSFVELLLWAAALEPATQHSGLPAETRCRYIFRYFDTNRDLKLEYIEFKELMAAARAARQLPVDALSVAREADVCLRQLGLLPNAPLPLNDFLRGVGELRLRGTSSLLRSPRSISGYLVDLQERDRELKTPTASKLPPYVSQQDGVVVAEPSGAPAGSSCAGAARAASGAANKCDYTVAVYTVGLKRGARNELLELHHFDEDAVTASTARLVPSAGAGGSLEVLGPASVPAEAIAAVHYFAAAVEKPSSKRTSATATTAAPSLEKAAYTWAAPSEEQHLGSLLLKLTDAAQPIFGLEPRLLRLSSPVYAIGDLHGNLSSLLAIEDALWPCGAALSPVTILFLGDYVDRGPHGAELMAYLLAAKLQRPRGVMMLRGNHETRDIQKMFTFHSECMTKYGEQEGGKIWNAINQVFDVLPLAAVVDDKVFCCHGGIPPPWVCPLISAIDKVPAPLPSPAERSTIAWELLWNDPVKPNKMTATLALELSANEGFAANTRRGTGHVFDQRALERFLRANRLSHVLRAHELHRAGFMCQLRGRLVSVFSSALYCGGDNDCGVALLAGGKLRLVRLAGGY